MALRVSSSIRLTQTRPTETKRYTQPTASQWRILCGAGQSRTAITRCFASHFADTKASTRCRILGIALHGRRAAATDHRGMARAARTRTESASGFRRIASLRSSLLFSMYWNQQPLWMPHEAHSTSTSDQTDQPEAFEAAQRQTDRQGLPSLDGKAAVHHIRQAACDHASRSFLRQSKG